MRPINIVAPLLHPVLKHVYLLAHPSHPPVSSLCAQLQPLIVETLFLDFAVFFQVSLRVSAMLSLRPRVPMRHVRLANAPPRHARAPLSLLGPSERSVVLPHRAPNPTTDCAQIVADTRAWRSTWRHRRQSVLRSLRPTTSPLF